MHKLSRPHWIYFIRCTLCCAGCVCLPSGTETSCLRAHSRLGEPHGCRLAAKRFRGSRSGWLWLAGAAHSRASQKSPLGNLSGPHDGPGHQQMVSWKHVSVVVIQKGSTNVVHLFNNAIHAPVTDRSRANAGTSTSMYITGTFCGQYTACILGWITCDRTFALPMLFLHAQISTEVQRP